MSEDLSLLLAQSGEELALAMDRLGKADGDAELNIRARALLESADTHCSLLCRMGQAAQGAATRILSTWYTLHRRANPESFKGIYLLALADCAAMPVMALQDAINRSDAFAATHWDAIARQQTALAGATIRKFDLPLPDDPDTRRLFMDICTAKDVPDTFDSTPISAFSALDILQDSASRLHALGLT